jgi:hypothetical protein
LDTLPNNENDDTVMIAWNTLLHIRYPSPVVVKRDFASKNVLAIQLVDGFLQSKSTDTNCTCWKMVEAKDEFEIQHKHPQLSAT